MCLIHYDPLTLDFVDDVAIKLLKLQLLEHLLALVVDRNLHPSNKKIYHQHFPYIQFLPR